MVRDNISVNWETLINSTSTFDKNVHVFHRVLHCVCDEKLSTLIKICKKIKILHYCFTLQYMTKKSTDLN